MEYISQFICYIESIVVLSVGVALHLQPYHLDTMAEMRRTSDQNKHDDVILWKFSVIAIPRLLASLHHSSAALQSVCRRDAVAAPQHTIHNVDRYIYMYEYS